MELFLDVGRIKLGSRRSQLCVKRLERVASRKLVCTHAAAWLVNAVSSTCKAARVGRVDALGRPAELELLAVEHKVLLMMVCTRADAHG